MLIETKQNLRRIVLPLARGLAGAGILPNHLTTAGLVAAALSGVALALGNLPAGLIWLLISLLCDLLDGDVARLRGAQGSSFGAFFDSTADRLSEAIVFGGLLVGKSHHGGGLGWFWIVAWVLTLTGSFLVSYTRARAEGLGLECRVGIADRSLRMALVILMLLLGFGASVYFLAALSLLAWVTVFQRIAHVHRQAVAAAPGSAPAGDADS